METTAFSNLFYDKGEQKIVYIGGSITEGAGAANKARRWSTQLTEYFNTLPLGNTHFTEINEGIGGTESTYGMLRVDRDVAAHDCDVVFIDFAANDTCISEDLSAIMFEGMIRRIMMYPKVPYVIGIGVVNNRKDRTRASLHKAIMQHYGLAFIDVQEGMDNILGEANIGVNTARDALFRPDNVHPVEKGYDFYTKYIIDNLTEDSFQKPVGEPIRPDFCSFSGTFMNADQSEHSGAWTAYGEGNWNERNLGRAGSGLMSSDPNASLTFTFSGKAFMLCYRLGRTFGKMSVTFDGKETIMDLFYETDNQPVTGISSFDLEDTTHTITIRPLGTKNEKSSSCDIKIDFIVVPKFFS